MVSRNIAAKSPSSSTRIGTRNPSQRRRHKSLTHNLVSSVNKSFSSCCRRVLKFFQHPTAAANLWNQFLFLGRNNNIVVETAKRNPNNGSRRFPSLLPPLERGISNEKQRTIVLDLDETLVHSFHDPPPDMRFDFVINPIIDDQVMSYYVLKRPGLEEFLRRISEFEVVVFTAGLREYATLVLDQIDKEGVISHRLFRDSCKEVDGKLVKDLSELGRDLGRVVIFDDNPNAYAFQPENAIPVRPFANDREDRELVKMLRFFDGCWRFGDMRDAVKEFLDDEEHAIMNRLGF